VCPECGGEYDTETIELTGEAAGAHVTVLNASRRQIRREIIPRETFRFVFLALWVAFVCVMPGARQTFLPALVVIGLLLASAALNVMRRILYGRAVVRVRMNQAGIVQDNDAEAPEGFESLRRAAPYVRIVVAAATFLIGLRYLNPAWIWMGLAATVGFCWSLRAEWIARRHVRQTPDGERLTSIGRKEVLSPSPWGQVRSFTVEPTPGDTQRFRLVVTVRSTPKGKQQEARAADIEIALCPEQADALHNRMTAWRQSAEAQKRAAAAQAMRSMLPKAVERA
jgi:hypothetical protein